MRSKIPFGKLLSLSVLGFVFVDSVAATVGSGISKLPLGASVLISVGAASHTLHGSGRGKSRVYLSGLKRCARGISKVRRS